VIARTRVNYTWRDLRATWRISERGRGRRDLLARRLAECCGQPEVLLTGSGRGGLYLLLKALPHPRVLVPAYTCRAVVEAACLAGKTVLFAETEADGFNMAAGEVERELDERTVLVATHQFGFPCDIAGLSQIARRKGAFVIEDAAAALGARCAGRPAGAWGDAAFFSFDSTKLVQAPLKAGFVAMSDQALRRRCEEVIATETRPMPLGRSRRRLLAGVALTCVTRPAWYRLFHSVSFRWRGRCTGEESRPPVRLTPFYTDRMTEWQAALLLPQIERLDGLLEERRRLYATYLDRLHGAMGFRLPPPDRRREWAPIRFPILVEGDKHAFYRRAVELGVDFAFSFTHLAAPAAFARSWAIANSVLDVPFFSGLTAAEVDQVVNVLRRVGAELSSAAQR